jgi:hypothetical protein
MQLAKVTPKMLENEGSWDPVVLCGPMAGLLGGNVAGSLDTWEASVVDGTRQPERPVIGAAQVGFGELRLNQDCLLPAPMESRFSLHTGDVLLAKAPPIKAAWISPSVHHHRFDATCYAVRNLKTSQGVWLTFCLNQFEFAFSLARRSVASAVPRINSSELRRFPIPDVPVGFDLIADGIAECIDHRALNSMELLRLQNEVAEQVDALVPEAALKIETDHGSQSSWYQRFAATLLEDSLVPGHVKAGEYQQALRRGGDWRPIRSLVATARGHGERLGKEVSDYRSLRLSDVSSDLRVPPVVSRGQAGSRNVYAEPLEAGEVLHSLLATNPRTVFVSSVLDSQIYPTDHWVRLRFNETPGAWALTMQTEPVARQLRSMTTGLTQQFATATAVEQLVLPPIPLAIRMSWDGRLRRWQRQRDELDVTWQELVDRVYKLLKHTEVQYGPWVSPFYEEMSHDA